jgi:hypothetical protein
MRCRRHRSWSSRALSGSRCGEVRRSAQGTAASPTSGPVAPEAWRDWQHHPCDGGHRDRPLQRHRLPGPCPGGLPGPDRSRRRTRPASRLTRRADVRRARRTCGGDGAKHDQLGIEVGDRVAFVSHNSARLLAAFFGVCGYGRVLVPVNFRLSAEEVATSSSTVAPACSTLTRSSRSTSPRSTASTSSCSATMTTCSRRVLNRSPGSTTRTRPRPSTTPRAPRLARRACRSPIATSGPTRSRSRCTPASPTGTSFCTRCRCFTPTAGGCRSR